MRTTITVEIEVDKPEDWTDEQVLADLMTTFDDSLYEDTEMRVWSVSMHKHD
jgi:hypothetical protein